MLWHVLVLHPCLWPYSIPHFLYLTIHQWIFGLFLKWSESRSVVSNSCDSMDYTIHGILQARTLEWITFPFSRGSSKLRDQTQVSHIAGGFLTSWATREAYFYYFYFLAIMSNVAMNILSLLSAPKQPPAQERQRVSECQFTPPLSPWEGSTAKDWEAPNSSNLTGSCAEAT